MSELKTKTLRYARIGDYTLKEGPFLGFDNGPYFEFDMCGQKYPVCIPASQIKDVIRLFTEML